MARKTIKKNESVEEILLEEVKLEEVEQASYVALVSFRNNDGRIIRSGETFESDDPEWIEYLEGDKNKTGKPVIKQVS